MAVDTAAKRSSALDFAVALRTIPLPDGTVGQGDRQHLLACYSGILAEAPVEVATGPLTQYMQRPGQQDDTLRALSGTQGSMRAKRAAEECLRHLS